MKRKITEYIVVHCSATTAVMDIGAAEIRRWHMSPDPKDASKPWKDIGYHFVIRRDGTKELGRDIDDVGSHVRGFNSCSVGICLVGGLEGGKACENFTKAQYESLWSLIEVLKHRYPKAEVLGHRDLNVGKACPSFDAKAWHVNKMLGD